MLARGALCRLAVPKTSARDLPQLARFFDRALVSRNASSLPAVRALSRALTSALDTRRSYATAAAATKPTPTVKRAVKAEAATKAPAKKKANTKTAGKTAKKPAATKAKPKAKKTAKRTAKKKAPKKAAAKRTVKKAQTPEAVEKANIRKQKLKLTELRKKALKEPVTTHTISAFQAFVQEQTQGKGQAGSAVDRLTDASRAFKKLTPAEIEHYNHLAREKTAARLAEYRAWIQTHTPQQINEANNARAQLRRLLKNTLKRRYPAHTARLVDDRQIKRRTGAYAFFFGDRMSSGDMKGIKVSEASKLVGQEWKALSAGEKKKYEDQAAADTARYEREKAAFA